MKRSLEKYIGQDINFWHIEDVIREKGKSARFLAKCTACNDPELKNISAYSILCGDSKSCGCMRSKWVSDAQVEDLTGQTFYFLTVLKLDHVAKNRQCMWLCRCICGQELVVYASNLKRGHTKSCGCIKASKPEKRIMEILNANHVEYDYEFHFDGFKGVNGGILEFDFAILKDKKAIALIEYQGIQHYKEYEKDKANANFGKYQREVSDPMKKEFCEKHNIPLFEIRYDEDLDLKTLSILKQIQTCYANTVPSLIA